METQVDHNDFECNREYWNFKGELEFVDKWFLMSTPGPIILISMTYLLFVTKLGPAFMRKRKAYSLNNVLLIYNVAQVILSIYMFHICMKILVPVGLLLKTCNMETEESRYQIASANYVYFICKLTELLDTVFFVLRKKQNQVSFLHVYHHFLLFVVSWMLLKYEPGYTLLFTGTINAFVHIIMYFYYGLSAFPHLAKYLWWKKYITTMQLVQFGLILIHFIANSATSECKPSTILTATIVFNIILFIFLFLKFYIETYTKSRKTKDDIKANNAGKDYIMPGNLNGSTKGKNLERNDKYTDLITKQRMFYKATKHNIENNLKHKKLDRLLGEHL